MTMIVRVELVNGEVFYTGENTFNHLSDEVVCKVQDTRYVRLLGNAEVEDLTSGLFNWYDDDPMGEVVCVPSFLRRQAV